jgi:3-oxoacyl-[acyl-carrier-protein] synthase III
MRSRIAGTGKAVPERTLTNADFEKLVDTNDAWIRERTGIQERRILEADKATSDLAVLAAREAIAAAGMTTDDIDGVIVATISPDMVLPSTASYVHHKLGLRSGPAFDVVAACAGFVYVLEVADALIRAGVHKRLLLIGAELMTRLMDWKDRNTAVLFGDGAGAAVLVASDDDARGVLSTHLYNDGTLAEHLTIPAGGTRLPTSAQTIADNQHVMKMNGKAVFSHAVRNMAASCVAALEANHMTIADVDIVIAHQANIRILQGVAQRLGISMDKFFMNIHKYGNTSAASVPIALDEAVREGRIKPGMNVLLCALGAGFSWGSAMVKW